MAAGTCQRLRADVRWLTAAGRTSCRPVRRAGACFSQVSSCLRLPLCLAGVAPHPGLLVAARALQGVGAAILSPAALSLVTSSIPRRTRAPSRARHLRRARRWRLCHRRLPGRPAHRRSGLAVGVLRECADRADSLRCFRFACCPTWRRRRRTRELDVPGALTGTVGLGIVGGGTDGSTGLGLDLCRDSSYALLLRSRASRVLSRSSVAQEHLCCPFASFGTDPWQWQTRSHCSPLRALLRRFSFSLCICKP